MSVPFIDLKLPLNGLHEEILDQWKACLSKTAFVGGELVAQFEQDFMNETGASHFVSCANGTDAIILSLQAAGIGQGHKVALPDLTFWASYEAIIQVGAEPVLIDIDPSNLQMDYEKFTVAYESLNFECTILPHLFGWCTPKLQEFREFSSKNKIILIEDAAQAFGVSMHEKSIFSDAEYGTVSFYPAKVLGGCMDGGGVTTKSQEAAEKIRRLANHGRQDHYRFSEVGWNSRMAGLQASYLKVLMSNSEKILVSRNQALSQYFERWKNTNLPGLKMYLPPDVCTGNGYLAVFTVDGVRGDTLAEQLKRQNIGCARTYPMPISEQAPAKKSVKAHETPCTKAFCNRVLNLPLYAGISEQQVDIAWKAFVDIVKQHL